MVDNIIIILVSVAIALTLATLILIASILLPKEKKKPEKAEKILQIAPHRDCGACGYANCEQYAEALAKNPSLVNEDQCPFMFKDAQKLSELEKILGIKIKKPKKK
ncbi:MAG: (Fe-S)-binding protein [Candidatus Humimicrobiaceae bacterium]